MATHKFPSDLTASTGFTGADTPFTKLSFVKYYHKNNIIDADRLSANVRSGGQYGPEALNIDPGTGIIQATAETIAYGLEYMSGAAQYAGNLLGGVIRRPTKVPLGIDVFLPLPSSLNASWTPNWEMTDTRFLSAMTDANSGREMLQNGIAYVGSLLLERVQQVMAARVPNPRKQALFNGIEPRTFSFSWILSPQSEREANTIQAIVKEFAKYSLPKLVANGSQFEFPAEFEISFHNIEGAPKLASCVCTGVSCDLGPSSIQLLNSGHTIQTALTLSFMETELRTQDSPGI